MELSHFHRPLPAPRGRLWRFPGTITKFGASPPAGTAPPPLCPSPDPLPSRPVGQWTAGLVWVGGGSGLPLPLGSVCSLGGQRSQRRTVVVRGGRSDIWCRYIP